MDVTAHQQQLGFSSRAVEQLHPKTYRRYDVTAADERAPPAGRRQTADTRRQSCRLIGCYISAARLPASAQ